MVGVGEETTGAVNSRDRLEGRRDGEGAREGGRASESKTGAAGEPA
jgi:hypothetical protein